MLSTSTSNISEHDKAFVRISNYFVMHRGKGSALSSADADALDTWIQDGHAWMDILQAIDTAFAKLRTPPSTIRSCGRFLPTDAQLDELLDPNILAAAFGQQQAVEMEKTRIVGAVEDPCADALRHLVEAADDTHSTIARAAYLELRQDILERQAEGPLSPETIAIFDEALALVALEKLPRAQREAIEARIDAEAVAMRTRTLLELVGAAADLNYPRLGRLHTR